MDNELDNLRRTARAYMREDSSPYDSIGMRYKDKMFARIYAAYLLLEPVYTDYRYNYHPTKTKQVTVVYEELERLIGRFVVETDYTKPKEINDGQD